MVSSSASVCLGVDVGVMCVRDRWFVLHCVVSFWLLKGRRTVGADDDDDELATPDNKAHQSDRIL